MGTPVVWEGNVGNAAEHRSFANGNKDPRHMLRLNVMFDNSIPDGQGGYKDRGGFWANVEWWHQDAERFAALFQKGMRVVVIGRAIMDSWTDKQSGQEVSALKVEASRIAILPHRIEHVSLSGGGGGQRARDAHLAVAVLDLDFAQLRVVEQLGERANERRIDVDAIVFMVTHENFSCCCGAVVANARTPIFDAPYCQRRAAASSASV